MKPAQQREVVAFFRAGFTVSERRACRVAGVPRARCRDRSRAQDQPALRLRLPGALWALAGARVRDGDRRLPILLAREGWHSTHQRVSRRYRLEGLSLRLKTREKRASIPRVPQPPAERPNQRWSRDVVADRLADGRRFRILTVVDNVSRMSPALAADCSPTGERGGVVPDRLTASGGLPEASGVDNGPACSSRALDDGAHRNGVQLAFSRPGRPTDNPCIASCNGHCREACLDQH